MHKKEFPKFKNDNLDKKINIVGRKKFNKTISDLRVRNKKIDIFMKNNENKQELASNQKHKSEDRDLKISKSKPNILNYVKYQENYTNWVEKIKFNLVDRDKIKSSGNLRKTSSNIKPGIKLFKYSKKMTNNFPEIIKDSSIQRINRSLEKNKQEDFKTKMISINYNSLTTKDEECSNNLRKKLTDINIETVSNFWKFTHDNDSNHNLLRKIYDKKLIIDLKLIKDAHSSHLERINSKEEKKTVNSEYIESKIIKTKKKILFIKGIIDYAFPKMMVYKIQSVNKLKNLKSKSVSPNKYINSEVFSKEMNSKQIKLLVKKDKTNSNKSRADKMETISSQSGIRFRNTILLSKTKFMSHEKSSDFNTIKRIKLSSPLKFKSFSSTLLTK